MKLKTNLMRLPLLLSLLTMTACSNQDQAAAPGTEPHSKSPQTNRGTTQQEKSKGKSQYPMAIDPSKVGTYPRITKSGGGYFYDEVLEYRVWIDDPGGDHYQAFVTYEEAQSFSQKTKGAEEPLVLVLQREHINEPEPGVFVPAKADRVTEWRVEWLKANKRQENSITDFMRSKSGNKKTD